MASPRPILKRSQSQQCPTATAGYPRSSLLHGSPPHGVHFPPSPALTRTFSAYSPSTYDRSPIVVTPNSCALPERGCPGRTYTLDESPMNPPMSYASGWRPHSGRHLHPRAVNASYRDIEEENEDDDEALRTPTCTMPPLPRLIPDLSSESSEESDEFTSPPEPIAFFPISYYPPPHTNPNNLPSHPPIPHAPYRYSSEGKQSYFSGTLNALSFLPHAPSPEDEDQQKVRRRKHRDPSKMRDEKQGTSPDRRRRADGSYKSLSVCKALANCSLDDAEAGCLGGF